MYRFYIIILCFFKLVLAAEHASLTDLFEIAKPIYININDTENLPNAEEESIIIKEGIRCGERNNMFMPKIVGGSNAIKGEFPWQVSLQLQTGFSLRHICGGAILNDQWVITAAHCVKDIGTGALTVVAGEHNLYVKEGGEQRRQIAQIFINRFNISSFSNDIALLKLETPFRYFTNRLIAPICLPNKDDYFNGNGLISGWGRLHEDGTSPEILQYVSVPLITKQECRAKYQNSGYADFLHNCQICASAVGGGKDSCQGDSGGPLICRKDNYYVLCGIVSWGVGCGRAEFPGVYTQVSCYLNWIEDVINRN